MQDKKIDRRTFLSTGVSAGVAVCGVCFCSRMAALAEDDTTAATAATDTTAATATPQPLDPKALTFCGYSCPPDCKMLQGTLEDDDALKREAYELWKLEERFGIEFDPQKVICYGCKTLDKPEGEVVARCDVRACTREKKLECCIECDELKACAKDLWQRFPDFKQQVIAMQQQYRDQSR